MSCFVVREGEVKRQSHWPICAKNRKEKYNLIRQKKIIMESAVT
jgi:hypothetical protein